MKNLKITALLVAATIALGACGSRTDDGEVAAVDALTVRVLSDAASMPTGSSDTATISVLVTDSNNNAVSGSDVAFSATGGVLQDISTATNTDGAASARLNMEQDFENKDIVVTVSTGGTSGQARIAAVGSALNVSGTNSLIGGDVAEIFATLENGDGDPIANEVVSVSSSSGNSITPSVLLTDANGSIEFTVSSENSADTLTLTALNETVSATHSFDVVTDLLTFTDISDREELLVGSNPSVVSNVVTVNWVNQGVAVSGEQLSFTITAGSFVGGSTVTTNASGNASVSVISDSAGPATISVQALSNSSVVSNVDVEFVATDPASVAIDASSTRVNVGDVSTITALVKDDLGNPVKNSIVNFSSADLQGGQLSPALGYTNSSGVASVSFEAGDNATAQDAIVIQASVSGTNFSDSLNLTVFEQQLNLTMGTSNEIIVSNLQNQYSLQFVVQVSDGSGQALEGATVSASVRPTYYIKGQLELVSDEEISRWVTSNDYILCPAEDFNGDRVLGAVETSNGTESEDFNANGSLDPQDPATLVAVADSETYATLSGGSLETDSTGSGYFNLLYPASNAQWAGVEVTVRAEALGTEATVSFPTGLPNSAEVLNDFESTPANQRSPYGTFDLRTGVYATVTAEDGTELPVVDGCTTVD